MKEKKIKNINMAVKQKYHFVEWNKEKIANLWDISEEIPQIQEQFYPEIFIEIYFGVHVSS